MKTPNAFAQFRILLANGIKSELSDLERLISPLLFALTILILFAFAVGEVEPDMRIKLFVAEVFLTTFLALQISFSRVFEPARTDKVFDLLRTYPVSYNAWFLAKYVLVVILGLSVAMPTIFIGALSGRFGLGYYSRHSSSGSWVICVGCFTCRYHHESSITPDLISTTLFSNDSTRSTQRDPGVSDLPGKRRL